MELVTRNFIAKNHKVLVVDDEPEITKEICRRYATEGYQILQASSGNQAASMISTESPDLMLTDIRMFDGDGLELITHVTKLPQPHPIIFCMTAYNDINPAQAFDSGIDLFLPKPLDLTMLMNATRHFLAEREALVRALTDLNSLIDSLPGIVFVVRATGDILYGNRSGRSLALKHSASFESATLQQFAQQEHATEICRMLAPSGDNSMHCWVGEMNLGKECPSQVELFFVDGTWHNELVKFVMVADISKLIETFRSSERERDATTSAVYHELRNALTILSASGTMLKEIPLDPQASKHVARIGRTTAHLMCIIHDLSDLSAIQSGRHLLRPLEFQVSTLLQSLADETSCNNAEIQRRLKVQCDTRIPKVLIGPTVRLRQILQNLINNALKYGDASTHVQISASLVEKGETKIWIEFTVQDSGPGIPKEDIPHVFEPFYRGKQEEGLKEGTGLGLFVCKRITEVMGGSIMLTSELGLGTTVTLRVPLSQ